MKEEIIKKLLEQKEKAEKNLSHAIHNEYNPFFHKSRSGYLRSLEADRKKFEWAEENNFKMIEITEKDLEHLSSDYIEKKFGIDIV